MKKLLMTLSALGITASSAATVISCGNTDRDPVNDTVINNIATELEQKTATSLTIDVPNNEQTQDKIKEKLISTSPILNKYKKQLTVNVTGFSASSASGDKGKITLEVLHQQENIKNPQDGSNEFVFSFLTKDISDDMQATIPNLTSQVSGLLNAEPVINLSNFKVNLGDAPVVGGEQTIAQLISKTIPLVKLYIPTKIPANFTNDANWTKFQGLIGLVEPLLKDNNTINETITPTDGMSLNINFKITDVLTNILPDLVHLLNFIEQQNQAGNTNLILNLIQYFLSTPSDINGDGFAEINQGIKDINNEGQTITFANNLERLVYDLLEGWKTPDGLQAPDVEPIHIDFRGQAIRYQQDTTDESKPTIGIFNLIPEANITNFINLLLGNDHFWDEEGNEQNNWTGGYNLQNPLKFTLLAFGLPFGTIPTNDLANAIKGSLKTFLNVNSDLGSKLDYLNLNWTQGEMTVWYQAQTDGMWQQAKTFTDLLTAKDLRIQFINNTWEIRNKLNDQVETINDKGLTLNLDITY